jgi:hypothetical protein
MRTPKAPAAHLRRCDLEELALMHRSDGIHGADTPSPSDSLPALVGRLGEDLSRVDSKLSLLKIEIQDDLHSYLRGAVHVVAAGAVAADYVCTVPCRRRGRVTAKTVSVLSERTSIAPPCAFAISSAM